VDLNAISEETSFHSGSTFVGRFDELHRWCNLDSRGERWSWVNDHSDRLYVRYIYETLIDNTFWVRLICSKMKNMTWQLKLYRVSFVKQFQRQDKLEAYDRRKT